MGRPHKTEETYLEETQVENFFESILLKEKFIGVYFVSVSEIFKLTYHEMNFLLHNVLCVLTHLCNYLHNQETEQLCHPKNSLMPPLCPTPTSVLHLYRFAFPPCGCLVAQSCLTSCDFVDCSVPGFPVLHHPLELTQIHIHRVSDAIHPSHPLSPPSPPAFNLSQHQGLFQ